MDVEDFLLLASSDQKGVKLVDIIRVTEILMLVAVLIERRQYFDDL